MQKTYIVVIVISLLVGIWLLHRANQADKFYSSQKWCSYIDEAGDLQHYICNEEKTYEN